MVFRAELKRDPEDLNHLSEEVGNVLAGVTFVLFGAVLLGPALGHLSWSLVLYAVLSLTIVRMVPVVIATGFARTPCDLAFMGWFGPRGLASIVFAVVVIEEANLPGEHTLLLAIYLTVDCRSLPTVSRQLRWPPATQAGTSATRATKPRWRVRRWR